MSLRLAELQKSDNKVQKIRVKRPKDGYKEIKEALYHRKLSFVPEIICIKLMNQYHNNFLVSYFNINKTKELISRKCYWPNLRKNIKTYVKGYNICLDLKVVKHQLYNNL